MHRILTAALAAALTTLLTVGLAGPAQASTSKVRDGDDIATPLDLASVTLSTKNQGRKIVARIRMHDAFTDAQLSAPSTVGVDFRITRKVTRGVSVRVVDGAMVGQVCTFRRGGDVLGSGCSSVRATRLDDRTLQLVVRRAKVSKADVLRWRAGALFFSGGDCISNPVSCLDVTPNGRDAFKTWRV